MPGETAGRASVRCQALNLSGLDAAEKHGKRLDRTSQGRRIRDADPLVFKTLDLRDAYERHMDGVKQNSAAKKPALHFIVRFPPGLLEGDDVPRKFSAPDRQMRQVEMMRQAVRFINETHGGDAVFAARVDLDEEGETIVDVFASPRYEKRTKRTKPDEPGVMWASATKFGRELTEKHQDEIRRRHPDAKPGLLSGPRMVGIALQSEFATFFERVNKVPLEQRREKLSKKSDRLEVEQWRRLETERAALASDRATLVKDRAALEADRASVDHDRAVLAVTAESIMKERTDVVSRRIALTADQASVARDRAALDKEAKALSEDRSKLADERGIFEREKTQVRRLAARLSGLVGNMEKALQAVLTFAPRVRRILGDAEASARDRGAAAEARRDIVGIVPTLRQDLAQTRDVLSMLRRPAQPSAPQQRPETVEESGPGIDGP